MKGCLPIAWCLGTFIPLFIHVHAASAQDRMYFTGPKEANEKELRTTATALASRCKTYGFEGITGKVVERNNAIQIELAATTGFPPKMQTTISALARITAKKVALHLPLDLTDAQAEQYKPPRAPTGAKWFPMINDSDLHTDRLGGRSYVRILASEAVTSWKGMSSLTGRKSRVIGRETPYFEASTGLTRSLVRNRQLKGKAWSVPVWMVVDGSVIDRECRLVLAGCTESFCEQGMFLYCLHKKERLKKGRVYVPISGLRLLDAVLSRSLPFPLRVTK